MGTEKIYGLGGIIYDDLVIDGANLNLNATLGVERVIDGVFSVVGLGNWVLGTGWSDGTGKAAKAADGVGTLTQAVAIAAVVGTTYKIVYQVLDVTVDGVTLTYGGVSDATKLANGTYTLYVTAATTGSLILTPSSDGSRFSIDNVSVKALTDATGDLVVDGNLTVRSQTTLESGLNVSNGQVLLPDGTAVAPSLSFATDTDTGFYRIGNNKIGITVAGTIALGVYTTSVDISGGSLFIGNTVRLYKDDSDILAMRRTGANPQTFRIYETYTDIDNYERYALIASENQLEIKAETLGTGADNLDIALTPAGTGNVKFGTYGAEVAAVAGYITIKDAAGNLRKLAVIA